MKPILLIGLGNPLMGDDGVGAAVAGHLAAGAGLPDCVEALPGGTDLLRLANQIEGRTHVLVIDALQEVSAEPGSLLEINPASDAFDDRQPHAHHLSALAAIRLLRLTTEVPITLLGVAVPSASAGPGLSPALAARLPDILNRVLQYLENLAATAHPCLCSLGELRF